MSLITLENQTIALAGIAQACGLVNDLAGTGSAHHDAMMASVGSVLKIDADSVIEIYGGLTGIAYGLERLENQLSSRSTANPQQARYAAQLVYLHKQLVQKPHMLQSIRASITRAQAQAEHFGILHENVLANLADVYHSTVSTLQPRIMVYGDQQHLGNPATVNKIRSLLLAGIRSTMLWRQCGGSRWKLLFARNKIRDQARLLRDKV
ncbi:MAG: high frequency lysogenization protein HflD [Methylomonas sp.]|nr:high frequency lysogenization protein HflD [Methylomonas sp.]PPD21552.1 MAG: lysogenization regulator HflD [Methylomonas sp.]PPD24934.1 MAG: lysogenization regulator HflD [Methylomonas sp.]PPD34099.1 MAG: lysogenization regulator HflD [Methylomonas sp.]PPD40491.1 MAG: lysogenization regulator HflD [Methylomonas sp.]